MANLASDRTQVVNFKSSSGPSVAKFGHVITVTSLGIKTLLRFIRNILPFKLLLFFQK